MVSLGNLTQTHPTVSDGVALDPLPKEDWDAIHYAIVATDDSSITLFGVGDTISECKANALHNMIDAKVPPTKIQTYAKTLAYLNHNETMVMPSQTRIRKLGIYYCESKVFIYAQRYGVYGMKLNYDQYTESPLVRFAGYDEENRKASKFKFNF